MKSFLILPKLSAGIFGFFEISYAGRGRSYFSKKEN